MKKRSTLFLTLLLTAATTSFSQQNAAPANNPATSRQAAETKITTATGAEAKPVEAITEAKTAEPAAEMAKAPAQPSEAEMMKQMMELAKTGDNHKLLSEMAGNWNYTVKMWMDPSAPATSSTGSAVIKPIMDGRYFIGDFTGKMQMPGADGKNKEMPFKGMSIDGYDNVKKKFISTWCDSMGTGMMTSEGTYDAASKTFTYNGEYEAMPGAKSRVRMMIKVADKDHHSCEFYEDRGKGEAKTMEISYTRKK